MRKEWLDKLKEIEERPTLRSTVGAALRLCAQLEDEADFEATELRLGLAAQIGHECALFVSELAMADFDQPLAEREAVTLRRIRDWLRRYHSLLYLRPLGEADIERTQML